MYSELLRFLDMARHRLGGVDARVEIGGQPPQDPCLVACERGQGLRFVVVFQAPPEDAGGVRIRLRELAEAFMAGRTPPPVAGTSVAAARHALDTILAGLVAKVPALAAMVTDDRSPLIWGWSLADAELDRPSSHEELRQEAATAEAPARAAQSLVQVLDALPEADPSQHFFWLDDDTGVVWRSFAGVYRVWLTFDRQTAALRAEGSLVRALPQVEHHMLHWPPPDPDDRGALRKRAALRLV